MSLDTIFNSLSLAGLNFTEVWALYLIPFLLIFNYIYFKITFVPLNKSDSDYKNRCELRAKYRRFMIFSRSLIIVLVFVALSNPIVSEIKDIETDPYIKIIHDQSTSMSVYSEKEINNLVQKLSSKIDTKIVSIGDGIGLGAALTANIDEGEQVLFISDGWDNFNTLIDSLSYAASINTSVHTVLLGGEKKDASVSLLGPHDVITGSNNDFFIQVRSEEEEVVKVDLDGKEIFYGNVRDSERISLKFTAGNHLLKTELMGSDFIEENNVFYKTIRTVEKPKLAYFGPNSNSNLIKALKNKYDVKYQTQIPTNLEDYHSLVIHDKSITSINSDSNAVSRLENYLVNGGGLIVLGGMNSFDRGDYKNSDFEKLLPVIVSSADRKRSPTNIVIVLDLSKSGQDLTLAGEKISLLDLQKSVVHSFINNTANYHNVALVGFSSNPVIVSDIGPLIEKKQKLLSDVSKLTTLEGTTKIGPALTMAKQLFINQNGDKNIILVTDGQQYNEFARIGSLRAAYGLQRAGIRVNVIKTGALTFESLKSWAKKTGNSDIYDDNRLREIVKKNAPLFEKNIKQIAEITNGNYFPLEKRDRLTALFSDPEGNDYVPKQIANLVDFNHFISKDLDLNAKVPGFNNVVAKPSARIIATMDTGEPIIVASRYGLGRTVSLTGFNPPNNLGDLLTGENSKVFSRLINYGVGDPNRMKDFYVDVDDGFVGKVNTVQVRSNQMPISNNLRFVKLKEKLYESSFEKETPGVYNILNVPYAMNYNIELLNMGKNDDFHAQINLFNAKVFKQNDNEIIDYLKTVSFRREIVVTYLFKYFAMLSIVLYLIEIFARRYYTKGGKN